MTNLRRSLEILLFGAILILSSGAFAPLWTDPATHNVVDGQPTLQALWGVVYVATAFALAAHKNAIFAVVRQNKLLVTLLLLSFSSALWSENPGVTLRKAVALLGTSLIGMLFAIRFNVREQVRFVVVIVSIAALASVVAALWFPQSFPTTEFVSGAWNGVFSHKNLLGRAMALGAVAYLTLSRRSAFAYLWSFAGGVLCFALLLLAHSQTAFIIFLLIVLLRLGSIVLRGDWRIALGSSSLLLVGALSMLWTVLSHLATVTEMFHRDATLTGRSRIWHVAALSIAQRPWFGYGYGAFWWVSRQSEQALSLIRYQTPHAHNGFLDLLLQLGAVGTAVFILGWFVAAARAIRCLRLANDADAHWPLLYLGFLVLYSFSENSLLIGNSILWVLYVATLCSVTPHPLESEQPITSPALGPVTAA